MALAAERRTEADLEAMAAPPARAQNPTLDITEWLSTDLEFHTAVTRAAGNRILTAFFEAIHDQDTDRSCARPLDHVNHLDEVRTQALADRRAHEVPTPSPLPQDRASAAAARPVGVSRCHCQ